MTHRTIYKHIIVQLNRFKVQRHGTLLISLKTYDLKGGEQSVTGIEYQEKLENKGTHPPRQDSNLQSPNPKSDPLSLNLQPLLPLPETDAVSITLQGQLEMDVKR